MPNFNFDFNFNHAALTSSSSSCPVGHLILHSVVNLLILTFMSLVNH